MHYWGDKSFDWKGLDEAIDFIDNNLVKWGRINVSQSKEKFGTARIYCQLGWYQFLNITHPRSCFNRYPQWLWDIDCKIGTSIVPILFNWFIVPYQKWVYRTIYKKACEKYPHLIEEICCMADYIELLDFYITWRNIYAKK